MTKDKWHGHIAIFAANILFGINIPIAKTLMPEWIDPVGLTFLRMSFGALAFWAVSLFTLNEKVSKKDLLILFFCAILRAAAKWQAMPLWPQVAQRRLVGARPKPVSSGQHGPKCQRRFAPYFHNLNAPFPAFFPARCSPSECQCSP